MKFGNKAKTFGTVIAATVLLVAVGGGGAVAGGLITSAKIKNNTIQSIDVRNNNLTGTDIKNGSISAADLAAGTIPAPPAVPKVRWALVSSDGNTILAQSGGISIVGHNSGVYLNMGASVAGSALSVTPAWSGTDPGPQGGIRTTICGGAPYGSCVSNNTPNVIWVGTQKADNTGYEAHGFYVTVVG